MKLGFWSAATLAGSILVCPAALAQGSKQAAALQGEKAPVAGEGEGEGEGEGGVIRAVPTAEMDLPAVVALLRQQQLEISRQAELLATQGRQIKGLQAEIDVFRAPALTSTAESPEPETLQPDRSIEAVEVPRSPAEAVAQEVKSEAERTAETGTAVAEAQVDDPTLRVLTEFPGAWRLPGTSAALAIGGYVKSSMVYNFDPLQIKDRFIVGSIPVDELKTEELEAESSLDASQSRLNFDLRDPTDVGVLRAFIEADFAGEGDVFRLRHAFGQWNRVLAGKTWSAFVDTQATPEELDFEGLNGRVSVRQSQLRLMPRLGEDFEFQFSLEDPNPMVQNGEGVTQVPDVVASARFNPNERLHAKVGLLARQIRGKNTGASGSGVDKEYAWGLTVSGRFETPLLDTRDSLLFQLNAGDGIGRYVNDLASVGNFDGTINPRTGELELFDILAGYVSWQHWWGATLRSNFTFGIVDVENPEFVDGDAYSRTTRASGNLIWTPTPRVDLGTELLWGSKETEDGSDGDATQIQFSARYRF